jgi:hypothetical protein
MVQLELLLARSFSAEKPGSLYSDTISMHRRGETLEEKPEGKAV